MSVGMCGNDQGYGGKKNKVWVNTTLPQPLFKKSDMSVKVLHEAALYS